MTTRFFDYYRDVGLLILRVSFGLIMAVFHGWGKISGGPEGWTQLGSRASVIGVDFLPVVWGFLSAFAEFVCALLVVLGLFTRPALVLLILNMAMAVTWHVVTGNGSPLHAIEYAAVWIALFAAGPGRYSLDRLFAKPGRRRLF